MKWRLRTYIIRNMEKYVEAVSFSESEQYLVRADRYAKLRAQLIGFHEDLCGSSLPSTLNIESKSDGLRSEDRTNSH